MQVRAQVRVLGRRPTQLAARGAAKAQCQPLESPCCDQASYQGGPSTHSDLLPLCWHFDSLQLLWQDRRWQEQRQWHQERNALAQQHRHLQPPVGTVWLARAEVVAFRTWCTPPRRHHSASCTHHKTTALALDLCALHQHGLIVVVSVPPSRQVLV